MFLFFVVVLVISISPLSPALLSLIAENSGNDKLSTYVSLSSDINIFYFLEVILLIFMMLKFRNKFYETKWGTLILNGFFGYILINVMALTNASFVRFGWYYFIFIVLGLPFIYSFIKEVKMRSLFKNLVFVYYSLVFFRLLLVYDDGDFIPYKSIFQDFSRNSRWEYLDDRK